MLRAVGEIERSSSGLERVPRHAVGPREDGGGDRYLPQRASYSGGPYAEPADRAEKKVDEETSADWSQQLAALRRHQVTLASLALIVATLIWKASFVFHYFFQQDDFEVLDVARKSGLNWSFLTHVDAGHFFPGVYALAWVLARVGLYNWAAAAGVVLLMTAAASLAAWRLLRTMLGNRPAILIPLAVYLLSPLALPNYSWWLTAAEAIPLQIALFMALTAHLHYGWTGKIRHAFAAAAWILFGLIFFEKSVLIPPLIFAITAAFLIRRKGLLAAIWVAATRLWKAWLLYFGVTAAYAVVFFVSLRTSNSQPKAPASAHVVGTFAWNLIFRTFVPDTFGGPWHWMHVPGTASAYSWPPVALAWLALIGAVAVMVASSLTRRRAWRGWAVLVAWIALADVLPIAISRLASPGWAVLLGSSPRYVADAAAVLAIVVGLIFWPIADPVGEVESSTSRRVFFGVQWQRAGIAIVTVLAIGAAWSVNRYSTEVTTITRSYIANAKQALAEAPADTVIVDQKVPGNVMISGFEHAGYTSIVLGPLSHRGSQVSWTLQPSGNLGPVMIFGPDGRLYKAGIGGVTSASKSVFQRCLTTKSSQLNVSLPPISSFLAAFVQVLRVDYLADPSYAGTSVTVTYGSHVQQLTVGAGAHNAYFPVTGAAPNITFQGQGAGGAFCVEKAVVGKFEPLPTSGIPQVPAGS